MLKKFVISACLLLSVTACQTLTDTSDSKMTLNGSWQVEVIQGRPVIDNSPAQLVFAADGALSGNNSCNQFFGKYQLDGNKLTLNIVGNTMKACFGVLMTQEQHVMQAMTKVVTAKKSQGKLLLNDAQGTTQLVLSKN